MARKRRAAKRPKGATKTPTAVKRSARAALSVATSGRRPVRKRVAAMAQAPLAVCESDKDLQAMLNVLRNEDEPVKVRLAALQSLGAAAFSVIAFESCRGDYLAALRKVATDPKPELRQRVLGLLMREKDGFAQRKLLEGLKNPDKALVPPEKALQLLSYDVHAEAYAAARAIVGKPPNPDARREALRLLAADATAAPLFEKLLRDKKELREIRQISASALHALKPDRLQQVAREIVLDKSDYDDIKATSLMALATFGDDKALANDTVLLNSVDRFGAGKAPSKYKQGARRFLRKYGR
jgi:HEAT repeat protein